MVVEDPLDLSHGLLGGSNEQGLVGAEGQQPEGENDKRDK